MKNRPRGFAPTEVLTALLFLSAAMGFGVSAYEGGPGDRSVRHARNVFNGMVARARAEAIESGHTAVLMANIAGDSVLLVSRGQILESVGFSEELGVELRASTPQLRLCIGPRGIANRDCNSFDTTVEVAFADGAASEVIEILPMGQIRW